jgi:hypothetical protein
MEIYVSTDVEADGPIPGPYSMLSLGSAAFRVDGSLAGTFSANLKTLDGATEHPKTMAWWAGRPEARKACRENPREVREAIEEYAAWLEGLPGRPVFVGYSAAYDFAFVYWYLIRFAGRSPFSFSALDIKTLAMVVLGTDYHATTKKAMPRRWFGEASHRHVALADAIEQGQLFCNLLAEARARVMAGPGTPAQPTGRTG